MKRYELKISNNQFTYVDVEINDNENIKELIAELLERGINWYAFDKYTEPDVDIEIERELPSTGKRDTSDLDDFFLGENEIGL